MLRNSLSWFAIMVLAGVLSACGQNQDDQGMGGGTQGFDGTGQPQDDTPPDQPGSPPANP
ncbi:MAG: hypothetical protein WCZ87_03520 [Thiohalobacteraceae bacterium]